MLKRPIARILAAASGILLIVGLPILWWNWDPERRWGCFRNEHASCAGCRCFIVIAMEQDLIARKDKWLPRGGKNPADSLAQLAPWMRGNGAGHFTSHALAGKHGDYYDRHGTYTYELMCYRYNEGLRADDPEGLIVMYHHKPTRWNSHSHKMDFLGRPVLTLEMGMCWTFIPEDEFQTRQKRTLEYLREHGRLAGADAMSGTVSQKECLLNLRRIDSARESWAITYMVPDGEVVASSNIARLVVGAKIPKCPSGREYVIPVVGRPPTCPSHGDLLPWLRHAIPSDCRPKRGRSAENDPLEPRFCPDIRGLGNAALDVRARQFPLSGGRFRRIIPP